jgi:hypothetical protein
MDATFARVCHALFTLILGLVAAGGGPRAALRGSALLGALALLLIAALPSRRRRGIGALRFAWASAAAFALLVLSNARGGIAHADDKTKPAAAKPAPAPVATTPPSMIPWAGPWTAASDDAVLSKLCSAKVVSLTVNKRGTSIKFKASYAEGKASARPAQLLDQGYFRADVAAYRLSRALGFGKVPPTCLRTMARADLEAAAAGTPVADRLDKEVRWDKDGKTVAGAYQLWVDGLESGRMDTDRAWQGVLLQSAPLPADASARARAAEGSRLMSFDFLIANWDRWSGDNTFQIKNGPYVWLDNAAGFGAYGARAKKRNEATFAKVQRFSWSFVAALRATDDATLTKELAPAGLSKRELKDFLARKQRFLEIVDGLVKQYGEAAVLAFD